MGVLTSVESIEIFDQHSRDVRGGAFSSGAGRGQKSAVRDGAKVKIRGAGQKNP